jgi:hypothetical protein
MKVLVDTSVWSRALRRSANKDESIQRKLADLIAGHRAQIIGPIRQEILSGIKDERQFERLSIHLSAFPDVPTVGDDYIMAATFFNMCRRNGVQGSNTDFLICAVAVRSKMAIFTTDEDFRAFSRFIPIGPFE